MLLICQVILNLPDRFLTDTKHLIIKGTFLGVAGANGILLSGVIMSFGLNFRSLNDKKSALDYLVEYISNSIYANTSTNQRIFQITKCMLEILKIPIFLDSEHSHKVLLQA